MSFRLQPEGFSSKNLSRLTIRQSRRQDAAAVALLFAAWWMAILLVNPVGDFPLNDDFSYGKSVRNLAVEGKFLLDSWLAQTLAAQVFWGAAFCEIFGFSFTTLRFSTLVLGFAGVAASYFLCRELGQGRRVASLFALTIAFNPLFFSLSFTFMTDVPFFACSVLSTLFFVKALRRDAAERLPLAAIFAGTFFALAATFVRQIGLMLPVAFWVAWLCRGGFRRQNLPLATLPSAVIFGAFFGYNFWLEQWQGLPPGYGNFDRLSRTLDDPGIIWRILPRTGILLAYLGAFLLPVSFYLFTSRWFTSGFRPFCHSQREPLRLVGQPVGAQRFPSGMTKGTGIFLIFCIAACIFAWEKLPWANQIYNLGLGPKLLKDGQFFINVSPVLPENAVAILKVIAFASGILLAFQFGILRRLANLKSNRLPVIFALSNLALYLGFLLIDRHFFDRYFLQLAPFLGICLLAGTSEKRVFGEKKNTVFFLSKNPFSAPPLWIPSLCLLALATFSVAATHDYLAWNRARWQALDHLTEDLKIPPNRIDGGFEFNGWHQPGEREYGRRKSWWWVDKDDFLVTFGEMEGFSKTKAFPFQRWLPPGRDSLLVLRKH